jgi:hypothetical protein
LFTKIQFKLCFHQSRGVPSISRSCGFSSSGSSLSLHTATRVCLGGARWRAGLRGCGAERDDGIRSVISVAVTGPWQRGAPRVRPISQPWLAPGAAGRCSVAVGGAASRNGQLGAWHCGFWIVRIVRGRMPAQKPSRRQGVELPDNQLAQTAQCDRPFRDLELRANGCEAAGCVPAAPGGARFNQLNRQGVSAGARDEPQRNCRTVSQPLLAAACLPLHASPAHCARDRVCYMLCESASRGGLRCGRQSLWLLRCGADEVRMLT